MAPKNDSSGKYWYRVSELKGLEFTPYMTKLREIWNRVNSFFDQHINEVQCTNNKILDKIFRPKPSPETLKVCQKASEELSKLNAGTSWTRK